MNTTILNRDFKHPADGWYQIEALGEHRNDAAKLVQIIDADAAISIVNRFNQEAKAGTLRHGHEMLIDHEHFSDNPNQETRAFGWLQELQNRADGIYGRIRWSATGQAAVDGGDYRFFSTEYAPADLKVLNTAKPARVRPLRLDGLTLTNMPNNRGQKPITNRENNLPDASVSGAKPQTERTHTMKSIATKLGLAPEASEDAILGEVTKLQNRAETAERELTPAKNRVTALETENQTLLGEQVDALLDAHHVKEERVRNRLKPVLTGLKNREDRVSALVDFGFKAEAKPADKSNRVLNRGEGKPSSETEATDARGQADRILNRAREIQKGTNVSFDAAHMQATREIVK